LILPAGPFRQYGVVAIMSAPREPKLDPIHNALLLDVDGTLLEIAPTPQDVIVPTGLVTTLMRLRDHLGGALAILSGRAISSIDTLFAPERFLAAGCHGVELRTADGDVIAHPPLPAWIYELAPIIGSIAPGAFIEDKTYAMSIHYRAVPQFEPAILAVVETWRDRLAKAGFALLPGKLVIDIKPATVSKGTAVRTLMAAAPFAGRTPVFAGDDTTDMEVLAVLPEFGGAGISVGRDMDGAAYRFATPADTRAWLASQFTPAGSIP
jgi:trehalose 6-phosphate phosphatase